MLPQLFNRKILSILRNSNLSKFFYVLKNVDIKFCISFKIIIREFVYGGNECVPAKSTEIGLEFQHTPGNNELPLLDFNSTVRATILTHTHRLLTEITYHYDMFDNGGSADKKLDHP